MTDTIADRLSTAQHALMPFAGVAVLANAVLQLVIALTGNEINVMTEVLTAVVALGYAAFLLRYGRDLAKVRFGLLAAHIVCYTAVNVGYGLHFFVLAVMGNTAIDGPHSATGDFVMDPGWFGVAVAMPALWGAGLLIHALGALAGHGFEASR